MRHCFSFLVIISISFPALCQTAARQSTTVPGKQVIDSAAIVNWADLLWSEPSISADGKYFMYPIDNLPVGSKTVVIQSTENSWKREYIGADKGLFSGDSKLVVIKIHSGKATSESVEWINLSTNKEYTIWQASENIESVAKGFKFDDEAKQLVFIVEDKKQSSNAIWYYKEGEKAIEKVTNQKLGIDLEMTIGASAPTFSKNGNYIFF